MTTSLTNSALKVTHGPFAFAWETYLDRRWEPLPLDAHSKGNPPAGTTGAQGVALTRDELEQWATVNPDGNIAVRMPDGVIGLDVDDYDGKDGAANLEAFRLAHNLPPLPAGPYSTSRGAGAAGIWCFRVPDGWEPPGSCPCPDVDYIRHGHRYAVVAPSIHPNGGIYAWYSYGGQPIDVPRVDDLPWLPDEWIDALGTRQVGPAPKRAATQSELDAWFTTYRATSTTSECAYGAKTLPELVRDIAQEVSGNRHHSGLTAVMRATELIKAGCLTASALDDLRAAFDEVKPEAIPDEFDGFIRHAVANTTATTNCTQHGSTAMLAGLPLVAVSAKQSDDRDTPTDDKLVEVSSRYQRGDSFILDVPDVIPAVIGDGKRNLWAKGESCILAGPSGVGKTSIAGQILRALVMGGTFLGLPVERATGRVLYLAMDRPQQIARSLARQFTEADRAILTEKLVVWKGPPSEDVAKNALLLLGMAKQVGASHIIVDSLKDAAIGLSDDTVGAGYNRARQMVLAEGIEMLELHHQVKRGPDGAKPTTLADVYGSVWITGGAGSVVVLHGEAGDSVVSWSHVKQPSEPLGPWQLSHDHARGHTEIFVSEDPLATLKALGSNVTVQAFASAFYGPKSSPKAARSDGERARRKLDQLVERGVATVTEQLSSTGGKATSVYSAVML